MGEVENAWRARKVIAWGHQGSSEDVRPNTLAAMRKARADGMHALEFDLHLTRPEDGEEVGALVLHHDEVLITDDGTEVVLAETTLSDLRLLQPDITTIDEVLGTFPGVPLTIEVKATAAAPKRSAEVAAKILTAEEPARPLIITSFDDAVVKVLKQVAPSLDTAPGARRMFAYWALHWLWPLRVPRLLGFDGQHRALQVPSHFDQVAGIKRVPLVRRLPFATRWLVWAAHAEDLAVHVWTVDDPRRMRVAIRRGVDGIMTNTPTVLASVLAETGKGWSGGPAES